MEESGRHSFFFSSRRRHTRSLRDWSSDVCSSDLGTGGSRRRQRQGRIKASCHTRQRAGTCWPFVFCPWPSTKRSEERRVGKERVARNAAYQRTRRGQQVHDRQRGRARVVVPAQHG